MKLFTILFFFLLSFNTFAKDIATINFQKVYESSIAFNDYLQEVDDYKKNHLKNFKKIEKNLNREKKDLETSKIILSDDEFNTKLIKYESNIEEYKKKVDEANSEIFQKMENGKLIIKKQVIKILQEIAIEKNIKIIFDSDNYIIAIKDIDLTGQVIRILNSDLKNIEFK